MITGVLLCGGEGRRFGGREKPLLELRGQPLAGHVLARLVPQVTEVVISANRRLADYSQLGYPVVSDRSSDQGPLAGILAAAEAVTTPLLFVCPGDSPFLPRDLVGRLSERLVPGVDAVVLTMARGLSTFSCCCAARQLWPLRLTSIPAVVRFLDGSAIGREPRSPFLISRDS